jgi:hypothetical protein
MSKFLIELAHAPETLECARVVHVFLTTGSHFLSQAEWGCRDGDHRAWMIVDAEDKNEARNIVPPPYRTHAKIVGLNRFYLDEISDILKEHGDKRS